MNKKLFKCFSNKWFSFLVLNFLLLLVVSCQVKLPIREMAMAKNAISLAGKVKAEKYAPEEYKLASDKLFEAHRQLFVKEDEDKMKAAAISAEKNARAAYEKSLPLLAQDSIGKFKSDLAKDAEIIRKIKEAEYTKLKSIETEANQLNTDKKYWKAYLKAEDGLMKLNSVMALIFDNIPELQTKISELRDAVSELKEQQGEDYAAEELAVISESLKSGEEALNNKDVSKAIEEIAKTEKALAEAKIKGKKYFVLQKIDTAEKGFAEVKKSPFIKDFNEDLEKISASIAGSKALYDESKFDEAGNEAANALTLLDTLKIALAQKSETTEIIADKEPEVKKDADGFPKEYIVELDIKSRDCLWKIALKYYNNSRLWPLIYMANRDQIKDPDLIFPGQKFVIPAVPKKGEKLPGSDFRIEMEKPNSIENKDINTEENNNSNKDNNENSEIDNNNSDEKL